MISNQNTSFQKAIDAVEALPFDDREQVIEILRMRITEQRRDEIAANVQESLQAVSGVGSNLDL
jgi:hypothetical protein